MLPLLILFAGAAVGVHGAACGPCHGAIVDSFARTGMGRSVSPARPEAGAGLGEVVWSGGSLTHGLGGVRKPVAFAIGSGNAAKSYAWRVGDALFESPLSWYRERARWDLSPGYEKDRAPNFYRPIEGECLACHTGSARPVEGTQSRFGFAGVPEPIGCVRCHGAGEAHAASPKRENIVNPVRLPAARRDSVCESCHLGGEARIPNPGRAFSDFKPGMALEEVFSVYVSGDADRRVTGHGEQMAGASCAKDPKLWCGSCHDPHKEPAAAERVSYYRARCVQCHTDSARHESAKGGDCAGCHMPRAQARDGGHTAFTDHRIRLRPAPAPPAPAGGLRPWRPTPYADRGLALAYLTVSEKESSLPALQEAARRLNHLLAGKPDGAVLTAAGMLALRQNKAKQAVVWLERALAEEPGSSLCESNLAAALLAAGEPAKAALHAKAALRIEPLLEAPYAVLAAAEPQRAAEWRALYRKRAGR